MAITRADIDRLDKALTTGTLTVEVDGKRVTYRSTAEIVQAINVAEARLAQSTSGPSYASFSRE